MQLGAWLGLNAPQLAQTLRRRAGVTAVAGVAPQLTADGAGAAALKAGYGPDAPALLAQRCQRHSVFWLQVLVSRSHLRTLPLVRVLHFRFETATFDFFDEVTGTAISAKTLDTTTSAKLARPEQIYKSLKANIDATTNFESYTLKGRTVSSDDIAARQLHVAVPEVTTAAQWKQIQQAIQYGQSKGVQVTVTPVR